MMKLTLALALQNVPNIPKPNTFISYLQKLREGVLSQPPATSLILASFVLLLVLAWILALSYTNKYPQDVFQLHERLRNTEVECGIEVTALGLVSQALS